MVGTRRNAPQDVQLIEHEFKLFEPLPQARMYPSSQSGVLPFTTLVSRNDLPHLPLWPGTTNWSLEPSQSSSPSAKQQSMSSQASTANPPTSIQASVSSSSNLSLQRSLPSYIQRSVQCYFHRGNVHRSRRVLQ